MIFQGITLVRIITVFIGQPIAAILYLILAIKLILRKKTKMILFLFFQFISYSLNSFLNIVFIILLLFGYIDLLYPLYYLMLYIALFSPIFILLFILNIFHLKLHKNIKLQILLIIIYAIVVYFILMIPGAVTLDSQNNYKPLYSWNFTLITYLFITSVIVIPTLFSSLRIYFVLENPFLKNKFKKIIIGTNILFIGFYGLLLFNTWHNQIFRFIWSIFIFLIMIPSSVLLYFAVGKEP